MGQRGDHWDGVAAVETAGNLRRGSGQELNIRQERESWEILRRADAEESSGRAKEWALRVISETSWKDDRTMAAVKHNVNRLMELIGRQETAIRLQEATVLKMRQDLMRAREIIRNRERRINNGADS